MEDFSNTHKCSECGAILTNGKSCQDYFDVLLAKEYSNSDYGSVHHISVPAYMLQHPSRLSRQGWLEMRHLLFSFIKQGKSPTEVRKANQYAVQNSRRNFSFTKGESIKIDACNWTKTISDLHINDASAYCQDVYEWANQILKDTEAHLGYEN